MTEKKAGSKFSGLLAAVKGREGKEDKPGEDGAQAAPQEPSRNHVVKEASRPYPETAQAGDAREEAPRRGRPRGKRSDPGFEQVTAYIGRETHRDVKIALLREGEGREFSELVEELLAGWLKCH